VHKIKAWYGVGIDSKGDEFKRKEYSYITEDTEGLYFFADKRFPVPLSEMAAQSVHTTVTFEGSSIVHFVIHTPFGKMRQVKTILSIEPFKQYVEARWYAESTVPSIIVSFFAYIGAAALEQDRQVEGEKGGGRDGGGRERRGERKGGGGRGRERGGGGEGRGERRERGERDHHTRQTLRHRTTSPHYTVQYVLRTAAVHPRVRRNDPTNLCAAVFIRPSPSTTPNPHQAPPSPLHFLTAGLGE
jgi:hypothetical protein